MLCLEGLLFLKKSPYELFVFNDMFIICFSSFITTTILTIIFIYYSHIQTLPHEKFIFITLCCFPFHQFAFFPFLFPDREEPGKQLDVSEVFSSRNVLLSLSLEEQKQAWIVRLKSYSDLDLSPVQKNILNDLISDLGALGKGEFFPSEKIKQDAIAMAKITPREDFINLFSVETLKSEIPELFKFGSICEECISDIESYVRLTSDEAVTYRSVPNCNCNWTCNQQQSTQLCIAPNVPITLPACSGGSTGCCNSTGGCGFLGLGTCTGKVICTNNDQ